MSKDTKTSGQNKPKKQKTHFIKELRAEWKNISWPDRKSLTVKSGIVLSLSVIVCLIVTVLDFWFQAIINFIAGAFLNGSVLWHV